MMSIFFYSLPICINGKTFLLFNFFFYSDYVYLFFQSHTRELFFFLNGKGRYFLKMY